MNTSMNTYVLATPHEIPTWMTDWIRHQTNRSGMFPERTAIKLMLFMDTNLHDHSLNITKLAGQLQISRRDLSLEVQTLFGIPVVLWMLEARLFKAQWMVEQNLTQNIQELARCVGFSNTWYFHQMYLDFFGRDLRNYFNRSYLLFE